MRGCCEALLRYIAKSPFTTQPTFPHDVGIDRRRITDVRYRRATPGRDFVGSYLSWLSLLPLRL